MNLIVALCYHAGDAQLMLKNLRWQRELCGRKPHTAVICCDEHGSMRWGNEIAQAATAAYDKVLRFRYPRTPMNTWPQGPNWAFQHTAIHMQQYGKPWLWFEADAIPLKHDWLEQLEAEYVRAGKKFLGYQVPEFLHYNGVAVYPPETPKLIPKALKSVDYAWDAAMREEMVHLAAHTDLFCHAWGQMPNGTIHHRDGVPPQFNNEQRMAFIKPRAVIVHRDKYGLVIDRMRARIKAQRSIPLKFCGENAPGPKVEIFIVSYSKDIEYLRYNLQSIQKFSTGFSGVTMLVPTHERHLFAELASRFSVKLKHYQVHADPTKWHLGHQIEKCRGDVWCNEADFILFSDSDCIFTEPVTPEDYFIDGKPVLVVEEYSRLQNVPWQATVEAALKLRPRFLTMCRHPFVGPPELLRDVRTMVEQANKVSFEDYVFSRKSNFPWGFSEFSTIGAVAMMGKWHDKFHIIDLAKEPRPHDKLTQFWSHSPPGTAQHLPSVGGMAVPKEIIEKALA